MDACILGSVADAYQCDARFNTICFLLLFLPVVLAGYWAIPSRRWKLAWITGASMLFYSFWDVRFVPLLLFGAVVDFFVAWQIHRATDPAHRKRWLLASIVVNLGLLGFFKYALFAVENARSLLSMLDIPVTLPYYNIILPVGISFYTFQTLSYSVDVYRGQVEPTRDLVKYLAFVSLFPQLVAGPIVRYRSLSEQMDAIPLRPQATFMAVGARLFAIGLFKKVVVADTIAHFSDGLWAQPGGFTMASAWAAALGYSLQLYFDFSGYSDMAIGLGAMLGMRFPINFRAPYKATDPSDFWRRWHVSLSSFLRDYLYIPLGGNRRGPRRTMVNLFVVMALGGLWHGAAWTFVIWGTYHGVLLALHARWGDAWDRLHVWVRRIAMYLLVVVGWVMFRAPDVATAGRMYRAMFLMPTTEGLGLVVAPLLGFLAVTAFTMLARPPATSGAILTRRQGVTAGLAGILAVMTIFAFASSPFLYYQF